MVSIFWFQSHQKHILNRPKVFFRIYNNKIYLTIEQNDFLNENYTVKAHNVHPGTLSKIGGGGILFPDPKDNYLFFVSYPGGINRKSIL